MAKSESRIDELRARLGELLTDWGTEISAVMHTLEQSKNSDERIARLETEHKEALARVAELERQLGAREKPVQQHKGGQQAEVEAMRAELAARKSLVKTLRSDAERGKALEKELAQNRLVIETMKASIERDARTIAELRLSSNSWERKYRRLAEAEDRASSQDGDKFSYSDVFTDTGVAMFLDEGPEVDGGHTVVIDMTEPLREARESRGRKNEGG